MGITAQPPGHSLSILCIEKVIVTHGKVGSSLPKPPTGKGADNVTLSSLPNHPQLDSRKKEHIQIIYSTLEVPQQAETLGREQGAKGSSKRKTTPATDPCPTPTPPPPHPLPV